jgi:hypothetical protein
MTWVIQMLSNLLSNPQEIGGSVEEEDENS